MKCRKIIMAILLCMLLANLTVAYADVDRVLLQTYPAGAGTNDLPYVGQEVSAFRVGTTTGGVVVTGWSLIDDYGSPCYDYVRARYYTLNINLAGENDGVIFSNLTKAFINNEEATLVYSADGRSATVSRRIYPLQIRPDIWHSPTDETHDAGELFSFTASAAPYYSAFTWMLVTTGDEELLA